MKKRARQRPHWLNVDPVRTVCINRARSVAEITGRASYSEMQHAKPQLSFWQIWNMCFGFLGLQFGFALQNANVSRIFQTLGAGLEQVPLLWIAAPFTGLVVQ